MARNAIPTQGRNANKTPPSQRSNPAEASDAVSLQPAQPSTEPSAVDDEKVRALAYSLWERAGRPAGDGGEFWLRAEQELTQRGS
ncbi:DUF2934 domain-containing protein [Gemmata algarum]|uniref:DUF2934 domain-containing protein n=1 Tax=Gemmata algarum TaxID=2975278 RepID=UPI0039C92A00